MAQKIQDKKLATIHYYDIGDYLTREEKLQILRDAKSIAGIPWKTITPNDKNDWINQQDDTFDSFIPIGEKGGDDTETIFGLHSSGLKTNRDSWCYNFSQKKLAANMKRMIAFYNEQVEAYREHKHYNGDKSVDKFVEIDSLKIAWARSLINAAARGTEIKFDKKSLVLAVRRPFQKENLFVHRAFNDCVYQMPQIFPPGVENLAIVACGLGVTKDFSVLITDTIIDYQTLANGQCFPFYTYEKSGQSSVTSGQRNFLTDNSQPATNNSQYSRKENISDAMLAKFQKHYKLPKITKWDVFYYVYGILHCPAYRERFASDLKKQLPRIPFAKDFWAFSKAGKKLADIHVGYERVASSELQVVSKTDFHHTSLTTRYSVTQMKLFSSKSKDRQAVPDSLYYNAYFTFTGIPAAAFAYKVNGRSPLEWLVERYKITTHKESGIGNDPNDWCAEMGNERYIFDLVPRLVTLAVESQKIIDALPGWE